MGAWRHGHGVENGEGDALLWRRWEVSGGAVGKEPEISNAFVAFERIENKYSIRCDQN